MGAGQGTVAYGASILTTSEAPSRLQLAYWREVVCRTIAGVEATALERAPAYSGRIRARRLPLGAGSDVDLLEVDADPQKVERTEGLIRDRRDGSWLVMLQAAGSCRFTQNGAEGRLLPGDLGLLDTSRPYQVLFPQRFGQIIVKLPAPLLRERFWRRGTIEDTRHGGALPRLEQDLGGAVLSRTAAVTKLATANLRLLAHLMGAIEPSQMPALAEAMLDYLALAVAPRLAAQDGAIRPQAYGIHLARAESFIEAHLGDPLLSVVRVARALGLSEGHLHHVFSSAGRVTVADHIRTRRLSHARGDLADPRLADVPIIAIAMKWGFSEASSFSRAFRNAYGTSPRAFRNGVRRRG